jgi:tRNA (cmo5U34)-methyltransferase
VTHQWRAVHDVMWQRDGEYLTALQGTDYRDHVFGYIEAEDTPRQLAIK